MKRIFVIGYPKSGNTWLIRMLARILGAEVEKIPMGNTGEDLAADINNEIQIKGNYKIYKIHYSSSQFLKEYSIDSNNDKLIYIVRNIYDVIISSFFYFKFKKNEGYLLLNQPLSSLINPLFLYKHFNARFLLSKFIDEIFEKGVGVFGFWSEHHSFWEKYFIENCSASVYAKTSYEALISDTKNELMSILKNIGLGDISEDHIRSSIDAENFKKRQEKLKRTQKSRSTSRNANLEFLRKGKINDHIRFLSKKQIDNVNKRLK